MGPGLLIGTVKATGRCDFGGTMLKFEDPNDGPRRHLSEDEQDLDEVLRAELDRLVSLLHPADGIPEERAGAQIQATRARSSVDK